MDLVCDIAVAAGYKSPAQIARVISENWLSRNGYCLGCEEDRLTRSAANTECTDFSCKTCGQNYELKTFRKRPSCRLVDGAYSTLIRHISEGTAPTLLLLHRDASWKIEALTAIHSLFLTPSVIEKRNPLSSIAVRAGWIGCNLRLDRIGPDGEIGIIENGAARDRGDVRRQFRRYAPLSSMAPTERGWTTLTLSVVRSLSKRRFSLSELYGKEPVFESAYPGNRNVRPKIRQQLQVLRDLGLIAFEGRGAYALLDG